MKSNTKIGKQLEKKTNIELVETILAMKKNKKWQEVAGMLSGPRRNRRALNLSEINKETKEGEKIVVAGKVLSQGELDKKLEIVALSFSEKAKEKILNAKGEVINMLEEIKKNPEAKGLRILK